jgi:hypothetical protein
MIRTYLRIRFERILVRILTRIDDWEFRKRYPTP